MAFITNYIIMSHVVPCKSVKYGSVETAVITKTNVKSNDMFAPCFDIGAC